MATRGSNIKITVTTMAGERVEVDLAPGHTVQDVIAALVQGGKLPAEDSQGRPMQYVLVDDATMSSLPGDKPLLEFGLAEGAELRVKAGSRVG